jgi:hypothetical protein
VLPNDHNFSENYDVLLHVILAQVPAVILAQVPASVQNRHFRKHVDHIFSGNTEEIREEAKR